MRSLPNLIVIGAQKCGTSGLHFYLGPHPDVSVSEPTGAQLLHRGAQLAARRRVVRDPVRPGGSGAGRRLPQLHGLPAAQGGPRADGETRRRAPDLHRARPDRADRRALGPQLLEGPAPGRAGRDDPETGTSYIDRSRYAMQLERFLAVYPREQILVLENEDLRNRRPRRCGSSSSSREPTPAFRDRRFASERHKTKRKTRLTGLGARIESRRARGRALGALEQGVGRGARLLAARSADRAPTGPRGAPRRRPRAPARGCRAAGGADRARPPPLVALGPVSAPDERPAKGRAGKEEGHRGEGAVLGVRVSLLSGIQGVGDGRRQRPPPRHDLRGRRVPRPVRPGPLRDPLLRGQPPGAGPDDRGQAGDDPPHVRGGRRRGRR